MTNFLLGIIAALLGCIVHPILGLLVLALLAAWVALLVLDNLATNLRRSFFGKNARDLELAIASIRSAK